MPSIANDTDPPSLRELEEQLDALKEMISEAWAKLRAAGREDRKELERLHSEYLDKAHKLNRMIHEIKEARIRQEDPKGE